MADLQLMADPARQAPGAAPPPGSTFFPDDWQILARHWYPIALSRDVGPAAVAARLLDVDLVAYRGGDAVVVADDRCPHRGVPLSAGTGDGTTVACRYHGLRFGAEGRCVLVPANPAGPVTSRLHLRTYPAVERYGLVWTTLTGHDPETIPVMRHWNAPGFQQINCPPFDLAAFAGRQVEGFLDVAHFGFVHAASFGDPDDTVVPDYTTTPTEYGFEADCRSTVSNYPHGTREPPPGFVWLRHFEAFVPFTATLTVHFPGGGLLNIMNAASPVSACATRMFAPIARNFDTDRPLGPVLDFNLQVFQEDRSVVELQRPAHLPLDPRAEVSLAADRNSIAYRRALRGLGLGDVFPG